VWVQLHANESGIRSVSGPLSPMKTLMLSVGGRDSR
jgi:hypothetical protein